MINRTNAEAYCSEDISKIENYEQAINDDTQVWDCHRRLEIQGQFRNSTSLLKKCGLYYNVPAWQLVFLTKADHTRIHWLGKRHSEESRKKMSKKQKLRAPISEETRKKMSISLSGEKHPMFGRKWWNNGVKCVCSRECPSEGWLRGRLKRNKHK